jgi:hypothetical protein
MLAVTTIVLFGVAAVLAAMLVFGNPNSSPPPQTPLAVPPSASTTTEPTEQPTTESPSTTPTPTSTSPGSTPGVPGTDAQGFVGHSARCDSGTTPAALVRTAQSLAVVCETGQGNFYYRGERLSDGASIDLANAAPSSGGFDVTNPVDGTRYEVRPDRLTIISNGQVVSSEPVQQYTSG